MPNWHPNELHVTGPDDVVDDIVGRYFAGDAARFAQLDADQHITAVQLVDDREGWARITFDADGGPATRRLQRIAVLHPTATFELEHRSPAHAA